jgi:hypothetical protein
MSALRTLSIGDIFHATAGNSASLLCVVTSVAETTISARRITSQSDLKFDREAGVCDRGADYGVIDSIATLPDWAEQALRGLDQRWGAGGDTKLTEPERRALLFVGQFYAANPV